MILLDHRVVNQVATRRLRIVKYRGSSHGTNEYPFLIDENGISVLPIRSLGLDYPVPKERISTGIPRLDAMLGGKGYFRGSSVLVSRHGRHGQDERRGRICGPPAAGASAASTSRSRNRPTRSSATCVDRHRPGASGSRKGLLQFQASRPTLTAWRRTW